MEVAQKHQQQLERIKTNVRRSHDYFKPNYDRFNEFRRFVFESSLTDEEVTLLMTLSKPQLEFNVLEAYISRLLGEFSKQEPDIEVHADDESHADPLTIKLVEQHLRHTLCDANNHHTKYNVYKDLLSGGFSGLKVSTDYANPMSFHQVINIDRVFDPTLCGFDQLARYSHKGDGRFCFELFPKTKEDFEAEFPDVPIEDMNFRRDFSGFNWSYLNDNTPTIIVADYYEKKSKDVRIVQLSDGKVKKLSEYEDMLATWGDLAAPPVIVGKPRTTTLETIDRYRCEENKVIEFTATDFTMLPLVFVDGNSVMIKTPKNGNVRQVTRPYVYHAKGAQRLKNYAGISWANEIENTVQHKFMVAKEALPKEEEFLQAYKDVQKANVLVYNSVHESDPNLPIENPLREVQRVAAPPEIMAAFTMSDNLIQQILGSYDASLGINDNQLSGTAIVEAATQSNATAMPYIVGYLDGYQRAAQIYVDLLPKYVTTPRTIPVMDNEGKRNSVMINQPDGIELFYDANQLNVVVKAGASFQVQKSRTIMMVKEMMGMSPLFGQFIAEKGLNFILDNMEGKGIEQLKQMVDGWLQEMQQQKQMAMQQQQQEMQNNPSIIKAKVEMAKLAQDKERDEKQFHVDIMKIELEEAKLQEEKRMAAIEARVDLTKAATERYAKQMDYKIKTIDQHHNAHDMRHRHIKEALETHHLLTKPEPKSTGAKA
jgi:hypothetical protein